MGVKYTHGGIGKKIMSDGTNPFIWDGSSNSATVSLLKRDGKTSIPLTFARTASGWTATYSDGSDNLRVDITSFTHDDPTIKGDIQRNKSGLGLPTPEDSGSFVGTRTYPFGKEDE